MVKIWWFPVKVSRKFVTKMQLFRRILWLFISVSAKLDFGKQPFWREENKNQNKNNMNSSEQSFFWLKNQSSFAFNSFLDCSNWFCLLNYVFQMKMLCSIGRQFDCSSSCSRKNCNENCLLMIVFNWVYLFIFILNFKSIKQTILNEIIFISTW